MTGKSVWNLKSCSFYIQIYNQLQKSKREYEISRHIDFLVSILQLFLLFSLQRFILWSQHFQIHLHFRCLGIIIASFSIFQPNSPFISLQITSTSVSFFFIVFLLVYRHDIFSFLQFVFSLLYFLFFFNLHFSYLQVYNLLSFSNFSFLFLSGHLLVF